MQKQSIRVTYIRGHGSGRSRKPRLPRRNGRNIIREEYRRYVNDDTRNKRPVQKVVDKVSTEDR